MELYAIMRKNHKTGEYEFVRGMSAAKVFMSEHKATSVGRAFLEFNPDTDKVVKFVPADEIDGNNVS